MGEEKEDLLLDGNDHKNEFCLLKRVPQRIFFCVCVCVENKVSKWVAVHKNQVGIFLPVF